MTIGRGLVLYTHLQKTLALYTRTSVVFLPEPPTRGGTPQRIRSCTGKPQGRGVGLLVRNKNTAEATT